MSSESKMFLNELKELGFEILVDKFSQEMISAKQIAEILNIGGASSYVRVSQLKKQAIEKQKFEEAADTRDKEKNIESQLNHAKNIWEKQLKSKKEIVTEENVTNVISMMTGIPVQRVATQESSKIIKMPKN